MPLFDSGESRSDGRLWYAMPYVHGESLRQRIGRKAQLGVAEAVRITRRSRERWHPRTGQGIVHRDIKPENILLSRRPGAGGRLRHRQGGGRSSAEKLTETGLSLGTPAYMSPEQAAGGAVDARSDIYALGCVLYEMLAGMPPFTGPTAQAVMARRLSEPPRAIRPARPAVPPGVESAVLRGLERLPADRFNDIADFVEHLARPSAPARRRPGIRGLGAAALLLLAVGLGAWLIGRRDGAGESRDPAVEDLYRRGVRAYVQRTPTSIEDAIRSFAAAVGRDSLYADAWSGLAKAYVRAYERRFVFPGVARDSVLRLAVAAADRALDEDPRSAEAWATRANVSRIVDPTDRAPAIRSARRALALDSTNVNAWHFLALSLAESGEMDGAFAAWRRAVSENPTDMQGLTFLAIAHYWRLEFDSSMYWADSAIALDPTFQLVRITAGYTEVERGDFARARAAFEAAERLSTGCRGGAYDRGQGSHGRPGGSHGGGPRPGPAGRVAGRGVRADASARGGLARSSSCGSRRRRPGGGVAPALHARGRPALPDPPPVRSTVQDARKRRALSSAPGRPTAGRLARVLRTRPAPGILASTRPVAPIPLPSRPQVRLGYPLRREGGIDHGRDVPIAHRKRLHRAPHDGLATRHQ